MQQYHSLAMQKYYAAVGANVAGAAVLTGVPSLRQKALQTMKRMR